jgi:beta-glucosidase
MSADRPFGKFVSPEHSEAARKIAEQGIVLLKNDKQLLPIPVGKYTTIAVIGENATRRLTIGGGSSSLKVEYEISPLDGLLKKYGKNHIVYSKGYASGKSNYDLETGSKLNADSLVHAAVETARAADIVLIIGGLNKNHFQDSEGGDRKSLDLPFGQDKLIKAILSVNKKTAVILISGNAMAMPWVNDAPTIFQSWYLGSEAGNAIANVVSGEVNPSGKLPFSFPVKLEDNAALSFGKESFPGDSINEYYKEDILVGYRWFDTKKIKPLFAFGHGLSYTSFEYGKISTDKTSYTADETVKLSFVLTNTGKVKGAEAAQVYISEVKSTVMRPVKELKAFSKVVLDAGGNKLVEISMPVKDWAFYNDKTQQWEIDPGKFIIQVGSSSADIRQSQTINVVKN